MEAIKRNVGAVFRRAILNKGRTMILGRWVEINDRVFSLSQTTYFRIWERKGKDNKDEFDVSAFLMSHCGDSDGFSPDDIHIGRFDTKGEAQETIRDIIRGAYDILK